MSIHELNYRRSVVTVERGCRVVDAARLMREKHIGDVIVVDTKPDGSKVPVGIVTDRDIVVEVVADTVSPERLTVEDIMCRDVVTAEAGAPLFEHLWLMRTHGVRRLPIVDEKGAIAGVVSSDDVLELLAKELGALAKVSRHQRQIEDDVLAAQR